MPGGRRRPARRRRRPEVGHDRPGPAASRAGPARPAQGARPVREPAAGPAAARALRRQPAARERIEGTDLLVVRELTGGIYFGEKTRTDDHRVGPVRVLRRGGRADRARRLPAPRGARSRASTRPTSWRPAACGARSSPRSREEFRTSPLEHLLVDNAAMQLVANPARLRRDRHREHVRRHPQRRGGDDHRVDRDAPERHRSGADGDPGAVRARPRLGARHRGHRASPIRWRCSSRAALLLRHGLSLETEAAALESAVDAALQEGLRTRDLGGTASTAEATRAVLAHL